MATKAPGTAVAKKASANIVSIQAALQAQAAAMGDRTAPASGIKIQLKNKQFHLPDGTKTDSLDVVIVDFVAKNSYYEGTYDSDNIVPPNCFAIGMNPLKLVPSENSPDLQNKDCSSCPMNAFKSAANGKGKACKNSRLMAVLPPDATADTPMWLLEASPTALKGFDAYVKSVASQFQMPPMSVVTTVTFDENVDYVSLQFGDPKPNPVLDVCFARQAEAMELLVVEPDVSGFEAAAPAKPAAKAPARKAVGARR